MESVRDASTYESRKEKLCIYQLELARLRRQACYGEKFLQTSPNLAPDLFIRTLIDISQLYGDEHFEMSRIAWHLVEHDVTDAKKDIIMRVCSGQSRAFIAQELGVSRQRIYKALESVPRCFRFDLYTEDDGMQD